MQCNRWTFTKHFTLSTPKKMTQVRATVTVHKCASLAAITGQITTYDNLQNNLCPDFQSMALLFKEVLHWSLKKP